MSDRISITRLRQPAEDSVGESIPVLAIPAEYLLALVVVLAGVLFVVAARRGSA